MTYDPGTDTVTTEDNLTPEEQDSLKVGEAMEQEQDRALAGKYKNAEELEKAYIELEKKLGQQSDSPEANSEPESEPEKVEDTPEEAAQFAILEDLWDQATSEKGEYSKDTLDKLDKLSNREIAQLHLEWKKDAASKYIPKPPDFSPKDVESLQSIVGGKEKYADMLKWANSNLKPQEIDMFDTIMDRGDPLAAFFAVNSLANRYNDSVGYEGKMLTGNAPKQSGQTFRSQAEVVEAMSDPRYENDPAYRQDVMYKLERSNIQF